VNLQKLNVKFFLLGPIDVSLTAFVDIFNRWIQESEGEFYDLADYSHVRAGPGILLVAHEANISIDNSGNRQGLLYNQKQPLQGSNQEKLRFTFKKALEACLKVEGQESLKGKIAFQGNESQLCVNDRLLAPNTDETFQAIAEEVHELARLLFRGSRYSVQVCSRDERQRFSISLKAEEPFNVRALLENLNPNMPPDHLHLS
jgi:hypothetical protein